MLTLRPSPWVTRVLCLKHIRNLRGPLPTSIIRGWRDSTNFRDCPIKRSDDRSGPRPVGASSSRFNNLSVEWRPKKVIRFGFRNPVIDRRRSGDRMSPEYATGRNF